MTENNPRIIKRYTNRKLYDTHESRYVTLEQIAEMIRLGEDVKVVDNNSKEDLTSVTLAQIIFEEEKKQRSFLPLAVLQNIVQSGGESLSDFMNQLSESAERVGRVFRSDEAAKEGQDKTEEETGEEGEQGKQVEATPEAEREDPSGVLRDLMERVNSTVEDWQKRLDTNLHQTLENMSPLAPLQKEILTLRTRIVELEHKLGQVEDANSKE